MPPSAEINDPLERKFVALLREAGIEYTRPEINPDDPTNLDFYLPSLKLYVEVKQFHTKWITEQLAKVPQNTSAIVLIGPQAVEDFTQLCRRLKVTGS